MCVVQCGMKRMKGAQLAKHIITSNAYLTLGTSHNNMPWVSPVCYFVDEQCNFYYASQIGSVHTKNILDNQKVAWAIFDSHAPDGEGVGVQIWGKAELVSARSYATAMRSCYRPSIREVLEISSYRLFKLTPSRIYVTDPDEVVDKRKSVSKSSLLSHLLILVGIIDHIYSSSLKVVNTGM